MNNLDGILCCKLECELGEGPIWHCQRQSWLWLDILSNKIYELSHIGLLNAEEPTVYSLGKACSSMVVSSTGELILATSDSIDRFCLSTMSCIKLLELPFSEQFRSNDGGIGPNGYFWFSSMEWTPTGNNGSIYSLSPNLDLNCHVKGIGIPNTMVFDEENLKFYFSDSLKKKMYCSEFNGESILFDSDNVFFDLSETNIAPDGGALDQDGNIWLALWGGHKVVCLSPDGDILNQIELPVSQPSSCCFGGPDRRHLFITTAREGLSDLDIQKYPLSGSSFCLELEVKGAEVPEFKLDRNIC